MMVVLKENLSVERSVFLRVKTKARYLDELLVEGWVPHGDS